MKALVQINGVMLGSRDMSEDDIDEITTQAYAIADAMEIKRKQAYPSRYKGKPYERGNGDSDTEEQPD